MFSCLDWHNQSSSHLVLGEALHSFLGKGLGDQGSGEAPEDVLVVPNLSHHCLHVGDLKLNLGPHLHDAAILVFDDKIKYIPM